VDQSTVSLALRNSPRLSAATKDRIQKTAEALVGARNLISQLTAQVEAFGGAKPAEVREFTYFVGMW
jgi:DNA-binding LacI/PurR family transcriptional regulator